jgi:chromosome partitioning protein
MIVVSFISQKGGVGKSTLARALAREAVASRLQVKIGDLDTDQATIIDWHKVRTQRDIKPAISVELFRGIAEAIRAAERHDLLVIDGPAKASTGTTEIARQSQLIVQPTGAALDDLKPAVRVFHGLIKAGIRHDRLIFALTTKRTPRAHIYKKQATRLCRVICRSDLPTASLRMRDTPSPRRASPA